MNFLNKLERKLGKYAIPNLTVWLIGGYGIGFLLQMLLPDIAGWMTLEPYYIFHKGQVWRIISWLLVPNEGNLLFALIMMLFYYQLGTALERTWGTFKFNVYIFGGIIFTVIGAFLLYGVYALFIYRQPIIGMGNFFNTGYVNTSIFLAFAMCYPDMQILLYFVIPIKMKWMAAVYAAITIYQFISGPVPTKVAIAASLLNFAIFFTSVKDYNVINRAKQVKRRTAYHASYNEAAKRPERHGITKHKCAVCGRTEVSNPELEFRFCSKCDGNYEYCQDHLFTHTHVKRG